MHDLGHSAESECQVQIQIWSYCIKQRLLCGVKNIKDKFLVRSHQVDYDVEAFNAVVATITDLQA